MSVIIDSVIIMSDSVVVKGVINYHFKHRGSLK